MGKRSAPIYSAGVFSTIFSTITTLLSFLIPPIVNPKSTLSTLRTDVRQIVGLTRKSQHRELIEFGEYVDRLVQQLVLIMENDQVARQANVVKNLEELQKTLLSILQRISRIHGAGGLTSRRHIRFPEEDYISQMRQELHNALSVFQFVAVLELLAKDANPHTGGTVADPPKPYQPQTTNPSDPSPEPSRLQPCQCPQPAKPIQDDRFPHPHPTTQPYIPRVNPQATPPTTTRGTPETGEISNAFVNVERCRRSLRHSHSPIRVMELASALGQLSVLLERGGRTREALEASQGSAELYRSLAEQLH
ncbi:hypothetical protein ACGC1H_000046 [Rhizoctonia solani]|uniref:Transmembrane protein n=1 Tax=Rhizoctonia solani TaxID=456999 RepID=A0A8H3BWY6_9AGAM|nr:unnamed protein product [Rhizoctonia solani]